MNCKNFYCPKSILQILMFMLYGDPWPYTCKQITRRDFQNWECKTFLGSCVWRHKTMYPAVPGWTSLCVWHLFNSTGGYLHSLICKDFNNHWSISEILNILAMWKSLGMTFLETIQRSVNACLSCTQLPSQEITDSRAIGQVPQSCGWEWTREKQSTCEQKIIEWKVQVAALDSKVWWDVADTWQLGRQSTKPAPNPSEWVYFP